GRNVTGVQTCALPIFRKEARQGLSMPWSILHEGRFVGQITVGAIVWGSARSAQVGYWIDREYAGRGITPTAVALAVDHSFFRVRSEERRVGKEARIALAQEEASDM